MDDQLPRAKFYVMHVEALADAGREIRRARLVAIEDNGAFGPELPVANISDELFLWLYRRLNRIIGLTAVDEPPA